MNLRLIFSLLFGGFLLTAVGCLKDPTVIPDVPAEDIVFALIGDYGDSGSKVRDVADMVKSWNPEFVVTAGDNNYETGQLSNMPDNIGQYYSDYIYNPDAPDGYRCIGQADIDEENRFFPSPGNHDYGSDINTNYLAYFTLPGNERFYQFRKGSTHFFSMDSNATGDFGVMKSWLEEQVAASDATFKVVIFHHPPFSASDHGNYESMQWNWAELGICAVLTGHEHSYQHIIEKANPSVHHIVNGLSGRTNIYGCSNNPLDENLFDVYCYNNKNGAIRAVISDEQLTFGFYSVQAGGILIDKVIIEKPQ